MLPNLLELSHDRPLRLRRPRPPRQAHEARLPARAVRRRSQALRPLPCRGGGAASRLFQESHRRGDDGAASPACRGGGCEGPCPAHVRRRADQWHGAARCAAHGAARGWGERGHGRRRGGRSADPGRAAALPRLRRGGALGQAGGGRRQALHGCRQHRDRRLRPRPGHGDAGACALPRRAAHAFCFQRRWRASGRRAEGSRSEANAVPDRLQDLHHAGDDGQRALGAPLGRGEARPRRGGPAFRGAVHGAGEGRGLRHRSGADVRLLGLGGRALFGLVRDRAVARDRRRTGPISRRFSPARGRWTSISGKRARRRTCR